MAWYDVLKRLYQSGKINETRLTNSVEKGLITEEQKQEILDSVE